MSEEYSENNQEQEGNNDNDKDDGFSLFDDIDFNILSSPIRSEGILRVYIQKLQALLEIIAKAFDDCPKIGKCLNKFIQHKENLQIMQYVCYIWDREMSPYYLICKGKDPTPFLQDQIAFLKKIDFANKYLELIDPEMYTEDEKLQNTTRLWGYIIGVNNVCAAYYKIPNGLIQKLDQAARKCASQEVSLSQIAGSAIEILTSSTEGDLNGLLNSIPEIIGALHNPEQGVNASDFLSEGFKALAPFMNGSATSMPAPPPDLERENWRKFNLM